MPQKSKAAAGILAILFGVFGVHKFYLGYAKEGVITLLIAVFGTIICGLGPLAMEVIGVIEGVIYLTMPDEDFTETYVYGHKGWF